MSNRLLAILVMIGIVGGGYLYYTLKYIPNKPVKIQAEVQKQEAEIQIAQEPRLTKQIVEDIKISNAEKIDELKENSKNYKTFRLDNSSVAYFLQNENSLDLFFEETNIGNFNLVFPEYLRVEKVSGTTDDLYIEVGTDKFYYNNRTNITQKIDLNIDVDYVKVGSTNKLIFVTNKGSFIYSIFDKTLDYFSYFNDFIYYNDGYIGLVRKDEKRILNNLGFEADDNNLIVYYNPNTKEKKIVYKTDLDINKISIYNNSIFIITEEGEVYELENLK